MANKTKPEDTNHLSESCVRASVSPEAIPYTDGIGVNGAALGCLQAEEGMHCCHAGRGASV